MSQYRDDLPWFPLYASNILSDKRYRLMSPLERFVWISILLECWSNGSVPADPESLAKYLGYPVEQVEAGLTDRVLSFFREVKGELISPQLEEYWAKQTKRRSKLSDGGKKGAKRRWSKTSDDIATPLPTPIGSPLPTPIGSLNTLRSNTLQSNTSLVKEVDPDPWIAEYEAELNKVKVTV
ncbi:Uncharacterized conserved protein YdaU, DUF1376 family [Nitrosospira sp. Nl5]|uniref:hypothetical protein n=1 Tax=Nitrosospira sp. Nl5 TaxID=200120 RepID=UPI00088032F0|nr:hypothetical protein [Nitrosospira sp. Nl5]SCY74920.1 Uncharacterized conserved protein YdaU, DUF1376 family [Nitrosospira sp. Nl5]